MFNNLGTSNMGSNNLGTSNMGSSNLGAQHLAVPNNKVATVAPNSGNPGLHHTSVSNKRTVQMISVPPNKSGSQKLSAPNKRGPKVESTPNSVASQKLSIPCKRQAQMEPSPKAQAESFESVRAKMRESLASALAMVSEEQNKTLEKNSQIEAPSTSRPSIEDSQVSASTSTTLDIASCQIPEKPVEHLSSKDHDCAQNVNDGQNRQNPSQDIVSIKNNDDATQTPKFDGQEFQFKYALLDEDVSFGNNFFAKDDLLQGNGLCWASDLDVEVVEERESHDAKRQKLENEVGGNNEEQASHCPQTLATRIEAELFIVFGGVNKKYKEKGRSLLFNLKDPNNPDLRERVISGEISPERLCSMTAEELASKELSQWRIAKAEELAQMVVLPDSEVDIRRLVRKTHKGEFQVEFEQDDSASVEVTVGASSLSQYRPRPKESEAQIPSKPDGNAEKSEITVSEKVNIDDQSSLNTLPSDGTDLMQGLMMDEMKDAEFLPPIVSLDEFMESLDSEPPFQNLQMDAGATMSISEEKKSSDFDSKLVSSDLTSIDPVTTALDKSDKIEPKDTRTESNLKSGEILVESETPLKGAAAKGEHVWEGMLQLNISSMVTVNCYFKSGEKTSTKEWPNFLDIKGRVKLDAFEKFLQELPMSRSRAIMVVHFCWKEDSPESGRENLREVVDSYVTDERVGFAEPAPAMELYFCPPHIRTIEMLGKHLPKDHIDTLNALDNGLIGIVVWRKAHVTSTISPNSSSHYHKHSSKKQNHLKRQQQEKDTNINANPNTSSILGPPPTRNPKPQLHDGPIDDIPPGFGPASVREDDDLPEFEFSSGPNLSVSQFSTPKPSPPSRASFAPPGQIRELIQKYGHNQMSSNNRLNWQQQSRSVRLEVQPWNDDDDIPEWQPQQTPPPPPPLPPAPLQMQPPLQLVHGFQQQMLPPHLVGALPPQQSPHGPLMVQQFTQQNLPLQPLQPPMNMMQALVGHQNAASPWQSGQFYGTPQGGGGYGIGTRQRPDHASRNGSSRGF
ncbi:Transcription elongation factor S-II [Macleaya cordata]|uniref:Transcription elongation factor S-II n=1 Tax=Macleaya cordata TaxID=56857 RepID=A0A200R2C1_MACCD|nr:Transcription elongation factor S-II [Macleaya cordata]